MKYGIKRELSREEARQIYESGGTIAIVFDKRDPETRVYEFSAETQDEPGFDKAVTLFEAKKLLLYKLEHDRTYEEVMGEKYEGASFFELTIEEDKLKE